MRIAIVHGEKSLASGALYPAFVARLEKVIELHNREPFNLIIITGGATRKNIHTEAEAGETYMRARINAPILLEKNARTTSENVRFSKELIGARAPQTENTTVITSRKRMLRARYLYWRLWSTEMYKKIIFVPVRDYYPNSYYLIELFYLLFAIFDPYEKSFARIAKIIFRNS
ncbi:MAG: YdcF family protein [Parcubacteria group bacterium]|nr:YdcF family protein [Parcubacteria group bacterium]